MALILGIDTSCDDTGIGLVRGSEVVANVVASQTSLHNRFGGVVPEQASREHLNVMDAVLDKALAQATATLDDVDAVAATYGPGLVGALLVGLTYGRALAWSRGLPFLPIHHLEGHIASTLLAAGEVQPPFLCLIASGGHTSLFDVPTWGTYREVGATRDDAAGEAFDKVARLLGLPYPGGPALSHLAEGGSPEAFDLPRPLRNQRGFDFSFSGLKTAIATLLQQTSDADPADVAASFEEAVTDSLVTTTRRAAEATGRERLVVAGGVAANRRLRARFQNERFKVHVPPLELTTDNGAMIALAAQLRLDLGTTSNWTVDAQPYLPLASTSDPSAPPERDCPQPAGNISTQNPKGS